MPYFKNDDVNILFIHIPKTGGTSIENYFSSKFNIKLNNTSLFGYIENNNLKNIKINSSLQHITYKKIVEYNKEFDINYNNIKIITIVRNPYERIISDLFYFSEINVNFSKEDVFNIINNRYLVCDNHNISQNYYDNHNIPQHYFIIDNDKEIIKNINILKTETLKTDMNNLGYTEFNNNDNVNINKVNYYNYLNNKSIELINNFYHLDFILFNYDKILTY